MLLLFALAGTDFRLSENVMHISCPLHTALRGSSRVGAAVGSN